MKPETCQLKAIFRPPNSDCSQVLWVKVVSGGGEVGARTAVVSSRTA